MKRLLNGMHISSARYACVLRSVVKACAAQSTDAQVTMPFPKRFNDNRLYCITTLLDKKIVLPRLNSFGQNGIPTLQYYQFVTT
jgi:hypothetical protein